MIFSNKRLAGEKLKDLIQEFICLLTGLDGPSVRPSYQKIPPTNPGANVTWVSFFLNQTGADAGPVLTQQTDDMASLQRHLKLDCSISVYGPEAETVAGQIRDGASIPSLSVALRRESVAVIECSGIRLASDLLGEQWIPRYDLTIYFRQQMVRQFNQNAITEPAIILFSNDK